jgi:HK97 family phage major capsid protein/HK97 family phage prohead protease
MNKDELRKQIEEVRLRRERTFSERENLVARMEADGESEGLKERLSNLNRAIERADDQIAELESTYGRLSYAERMVEDGNVEEGSTTPPARRNDSPRSEVRDKALRTLERHADVMDDDRPAAVETLIRQDRTDDVLSRYITAVGNEHYRTAFGKICEDPQHGHLRFSPEEVEAVRQASMSERAMNIGTGSAGGFALPFQLDPTIMLSSSGALNPVRRLARVVTVSQNEWRGISSDGVTVQYRAEAATMTDNSPVLVQPTITCRRWDAFVPYSWEVGQDWSDLQSELVRLIADGRDVLDASVFASGTSSSNQPTGLFNGLSSTQVVLTVGTATLTAGDVWALKGAIPPRFQANTTFAAPGPLLDRVYRLTPVGGTSEPQLMPSRDGALVGRPAAEWSFNAGTATPTGGTLIVGGDFSSGYVIADRLGLTAIPIPVLFSGNTAGGFGYPTGQSGLAGLGSHRRQRGECERVPGAEREMSTEVRSSSAPSLRSIPPRAAEGGADTPVMFGHFARFNEWAEIDSTFEGHFMERIAPRALARTLARDRGRLRVLFQHGRDPQIGDKVLGIPQTLREDELGGFYEVPLLDTSYVSDLLPGLRAGAYGSSFRFKVTREEMNDTPRVSSYNPKGLPERTIREVKLMEFGPVTFPAYEGATAGVRSLTDWWRTAPKAPAGVLRQRRGDDVRASTVLPSDRNSEKCSRMRA